MADKTILELTDIGALQSTDVLPAARSGKNEDNGTTVGAINTFVEGQANSTPTKDSTKLVKSGGVWTAIASAITAVKEWATNLFANKDGYYSQMTVGSAENLVGETVDSADYLIRPTGGESNEVANSVASVIGMEGNSCVWNQMVPNANINFTNTVIDSRTHLQIAILWYNGNTYLGGINNPPSVIGRSSLIVTAPNNTNRIYFKHNGSSTDITIYSSNEIIAGHKYLINYEVISTDPTTIGGIVINNNNLIDLTLLGIDNLTTVAEVEAWLSEHVGLRPYYAYNAGTILSAQTLGIKTYGQNLLNPTTRQAKLIPYEWEENSNVYTVKNVPSGATATFTPDATGVAESITITDNKFDITNYGSGILELSAATAETYVCMKWDEDKDDDVVPYEDHTQNFDVRKVYGKVNGTGEYVQCSPNGLRGIGDVKDTLTAAESMVKIGSVDLGDLEWTMAVEGKFYATVDLSLTAKAGGYAGVCTKYLIDSTAYLNGDKVGELANNAYSAGAGRLIIKDSSYTDAATFKTAMNGVMLNYELATPITYTDLIYRDGGIDTPIADALLNITVNNWSIEEQLLTPYVDGNPTAVPAKISTQYGMDAVEEIDTIKHTYVSAYTEQNFSDSQKAQARRNIGAVEENGTYPNMSVGIAKNLAGENAVEAEYTYRPSNGTIGTNTGIANVTAAKGKTSKWQQAIDIVSNGSRTINGVTFSTNKDDKTVTISGESESATAFNYGLANITGAFSINNPIVGHTYIYWALGSNDVALAYGYYGNYNTKYIHVANNTDINFTIKANANFSTPVTVKLCAIDLTDLFGAGNEPSTVAEFEAMYPLDYYDYTATPVLKNNAASAIETTGFNQWDEEWENGTYNADGVKISSSVEICSKNLISIFPSTTYYVKNGSQLSQNGTVACFYDANKNFIKEGGTNPVYPGKYSCGNSEVTTPVNARYMAFYTTGTTYNNDICINLSDTAKNGTYEPYEKHTFYFDKVLQGEGSLATVKGKLNGEGESVVVFPDGLKRVGNVFDEIKGNIAIKRIGVVDLGNIPESAWEGTSTSFTTNVLVGQVKAPSATSIKANILCSVYETITWNTTATDMQIAVNTDGTLYIKNSSCSSKTSLVAALSDVILYYELETPETYILDQTVTGGYQVNALGTEKRLPEDTASAVNAPVSYSVIYPIDAVGTITKLPINYISEKSLTNFTTELASKLGAFLSATIGITATYKQTTQEYDYSISITANENNG